MVPMALQARPESLDQKKANLDRVRSLLAHHRRLEAARAPRVLEGLHTHQVRFVSDPARRKLAVCSRRAGKTFAIIRYLVAVARGRRRAVALYIAITRIQAKRLVWMELKDFLDSQGISYKANESELAIRLEQSGGWIYLAGADDGPSIEKFRGLALDLVVLDEAGSFGDHFKPLIDDVLSPALQDYDGTIALTGTPPAACAGYFHDAATGALKGWSVHGWTVMDNPRFPRWADPATGLPYQDWEARADAWRREYIRERGWTEDHPSYIREILGRFARDLAGLVYRFLDGRNDWTGELPRAREWRHVMGLDLGREDAFAVVVWAFSPELPDLYQVDEFSRSGLTPTQWAEVIRGRQAKWSPVQTVADCGGLGKSIVEDLNIRFSLNIQAAEKTDKLAGIELWNGDAERGLVHLLRGGQYASQAKILQWDSKHPRQKEDGRFANDLCDAGLYGYRCAWHWTHRPPEARVRVGSTEWWTLEESRMEDEAEAAGHQEEGEFW